MDIICYRYVQLQQGINIQEEVLLRPLSSYTGTKTTECAADIILKNENKHEQRIRISLDPGGKKIRFYADLVHLCAPISVLYSLLARSGQEVGAWLK